MKKHQNLPDECTACTSCVVHCPVAAVTSKFRGPKLSGPALERYRLLLHDEDPSLEYCSNCKNCDITCPSGVSPSTMNMLARGEYYKKHPHRLRDWILAHAEKMGQMNSPMAAVANMGADNPLTRIALKKIGITTKRRLPKYASRTFVSQFRALKQQSYPDKIVFFPGCFINYNDPQVGMDFVAVMQANRYEVIVPDDTECCGSPMVAGGYLEEAAANAQKNIQALRRLTDKGYPVITCCTSCGLMLKREYQELFRIDGVETVAARLYDSTEFLLELYDQGRLNTGFIRQNGKYLYHAPCHLRAQGIGRPALELLRLLPDIEITDADAGCCGISGSYGFKDDKYDISMAIGEDLFRTIRESGADGVVSDCGTCRMQIAHGTGARTLHPMTLVANGYGKR
ncbi:MAG TPA: anaerobic glycerol-3-phosphate dehydrogenase subunit C [Patescibacteria group bacterium]|nr:anaerobic glycerol-3-phosphate dehydrogenase subunit C [Patescibacteria group bacterium]